MIEWVAIPRVLSLLNEIVKKTSSYAQDQCEWSTGTLDALHKLCASLTKIQSATQEVGLHRDGHLQQLKDDIYEIEDVLDEFSYFFLQAENQPKHTRILHWMCNTAKILAGIHGPVNKKKYLLKRLNDINKNSGRLLKLANLKPPPSNCPGRSIPIEGPIPADHDKMIGRDKEHNKLVEMLIGRRILSINCNNSPIPIIAVTGCAGIGKTTLAQFAYNDPRVKDHFNIKLWVPSPEHFDEVNLLKKILRTLGIKVVDHDVFSDYQETFGLTLQNTNPVRLLLVLNDVPHEHHETSMLLQRVSNVLAPLRYTNQATSSRILITTRNSTLVKEMLIKNIINLTKLPSHAEWLILKKYAIGDENSNAINHLENTGRKIANKLNGIPQSAKVVGGHLGSKLTKQLWEETLENDMYGRAGAAIFGIFEKLPEHLQRCFAYCIIFPKNYWFDGKKLVKMWMALNFLKPGDGVDPTKKICLQDLGLEYVNELVKSSLLQIQKQGKKTQYCVNKIAFDPAFLALANEFSRLDDPNKIVPSTVRYLSVTTNCLSLLMKDQDQIRKLRSLVVVKNNSYSVVEIEKTLLKNLKSVRLLDITDCDVKHLPETIGKLIHLRYLALCCSLTVLPVSIIELFHLETLYMPHKCGIDKLPKGINRLTKMRHLDIKTECIAKASGIGSMVDLHCSIEFHVGNNVGNGLEELEKLNEIGGEITIKQLGNVKSAEESGRAKLKDKRRMKVLNLEWPPDSGSSFQNADAEVLDSLEPHEDLLELKIHRYRGNRSPQWLETDQNQRHLKKIFLINCRGWKVLPPLGQLPHLKVLHMKEMCAVTTIGPCFYGKQEVGFPKLEELLFDNMTGLIEWCKGTNSQLFPELTKIKITNCQQLKKIPPFPAKVTKVDVEKNRFIPYVKMCPYYSSKLSLETSSMSIFKYLGDNQKNAIEILTINGCEMAGDDTNSCIALTAVKKMSIINCEITEMEINKLPSQMNSLITIQIKDCIEKQICSSAEPGKKLDFIIYK